MSEHPKIVLTIKAGDGFAAPWIVIHADNPAEAGALLGALAPVAQDAVNARDIPLAVSLAAQNFAGKYKASFNGTPVNVNAAPEQAYAPPTPPQAPTVQQPVDAWGAPIPQGGAAAAQPSTYQAPPPQVQQNAPQQHTYGAQASAPSNAPLGDKSGRPMVYKESKPGAAKAWKAWMGDQPRDTPDHLKDTPVWIR